jgi:hypothetical protein
MKKIRSIFKLTGANRSAFGRVASVGLAGVAVVVFQAIAAQNAYAHFPIIAATASCSNGVAVISYTVTSWDQNPADPGGTNPEIDVLFNGFKVDAQPFLSTTTPPNQFTGVKPAPAFTATVDVQAVAAAVWGDGFPAGTVSNIVTVTIPTNCSTGNGRFTGGGKLVTADGVTVTKGFEVDCDLHQPSNNLEINWLGNQFHMTAFTAAICTLQGPPNPPTAPVNTIMGTGTGRYNGVDGFTVQFELVDNGEPGTNDAVSILIFETANPSNVVLNVPLQFITGGNIQAHVDQR